MSRRFGIKQSSGDSMKVRLIDDFSASCVNDTVQVESASKLHTLDVVAALCMELLKIGDGCRWMGKTIDLTAAYRQLGVSPGAKWVSYIAVYDPNSRRVKIFAMRALPFGASKSVYGFLRVAHSLWWLGCKALHLTWSNFFDDFITLAREPECPLVSLAALQFFKLLGWAVALGDKDLPFDVRFKALGIEINCELWLSGVVTFCQHGEAYPRALGDHQPNLASWQTSKTGCLGAEGAHAICQGTDVGPCRKVVPFSHNQPCLLLVGGKPQRSNCRSSGSLQEVSGGRQAT